MFASLVKARGGLTRLFSTPSRTPPVAKKVLTNVYFGKNPAKPEQWRGDDVMDPPLVRADHYFWLRDESRSKPEVLNHLKAENAYCEAMMQPLEPLRERLYKSMLSRLKETDEDVPYPDGPYNYYSRTVEGKSYKIHCRKPRAAQGSPPAAAAAVEEVLLDENEVAQGQEYSVVGAHEVSPSTSLLAWSWDTSGDEHYDLFVKDLATGKPLDDCVEDISGDVVWTADSKALFYMKQDDESRPFQAWLHILGTPNEQDVLLFQEDDALFWMDLSKTADQRFLVLSVGSKETSESYFIDLHDEVTASNAKSNLKLVEKRKFGVRYEIESQGSQFLIVNNAGGAKCFKLSTAPISSPSFKNWKDARPYDDKTQVDGVQPFKTHAVIFGRQSGLEQVWIAPAENLAAWNKLPFEESCYSVGGGSNAEYTADCVRLVYSSLVTAKKTIDVSFKDPVKNQRLLKQVEVPNYDATKYRTCRFSLKARDGKDVPVSLVFKASLLADPAQSLKLGEVPKFARPQKCLLYGYGSYGACIDPVFDYKKTVLVDEDLIYAIAHIRGGGELGQQWYEDEGKYLKKQNTFNDFADVASGLISMGATATPKLAMVGRSAGGLLIGAVLNQSGHLFKCAVADVPFVDVVNTMSDVEIPLTVGEFEG